MKIILYVFLVVLFIALFYCFYQIKRNQVILKIRIKWIDDNDERWDKYSYDFMMEANKSNWYGLRFPKEKHFKK